MGLWIADTDSESSSSMFLVWPHPPSHRDGCLLILTLYSDCDPNLFELALQLREKRLDIEEALVEEKKIVDNLKKEYDTFSKKVWGLPTCLSSNVLPTLLYHRHGISRTSQRRSISNVSTAFSVSRVCSMAGPLPFGWLLFLYVTHLSQLFCWHNSMSNR